MTETVHSAKSAKTLEMFLNWYPQLSSADN